jgi:hypothetical protein
MPKIWTKPLVGAAALGVAGAFCLSLDGVAHAVDPLSPHEDHDTFQLVQASTTTSAVIITIQNTVTGDPIEVPGPTMISLMKMKPTPQGAGS